MKVSVCSCANRPRRRARSELCCRPGFMNPDEKKVLRTEAGFTVRTAESPREWELKWTAYTKPVHYIFTKIILREILV